jgi:hypothetical protein
MLRAQSRRLQKSFGKTFFPVFEKIFVFGKANVNAFSKQEDLLRNVDRP